MSEESEEPHHTSERYEAWRWWLDRVGKDSKLGNALFQFGRSGPMFGWTENDLIREFASVAEDVAGRIQPVVTAWSVSYETATIKRGSAESHPSAEAAARAAHDALVLAGLDPDKLAYHVGS